MSDLVGKTLGQYQIIEQLGQGGMATVYKAYQPSLDRHVAVKILPAQLASDESFVARFIQEARSVAKLRHPNIVTVHDFGTEGDVLYIVMECVDGGTLRQFLGKPVDLVTVERMIHQIGSALGYAHAQGIVHRDVKPGNVLLDKEGWLLLSDFGIAKALESQEGITKTGMGVGTPEYMAPEQAQGQAVDGRADIYALGVMLFELVTGQVPFKADTPLGIIMQKITAPLPSPRSLVPDLPEEVEQVIVKAMARDPQERYQTAEEMVNALWAAVSPGQARVARGEEKIYVLQDKFTPEEARAKALEKRVDAFGAISKFLLWPKPEEIEIAYSEKRYEPFWFASCHSRFSYDRTKKYQVEVGGPDVVTVTIYDRDHAAARDKRAYITLEGIEHCLTEQQIKLVLDAVSGESKDLERYLAYPKTEIVNGQSLASQDVIVIAPKISASFVMRTLMGKVGRPVDADVILQEEVEVENVLLVFRPAWGFEFYWKTKDKKATLELDGVTGETRPLTRPLRSAGGAAPSRDSLFDLGAEALTSFLAKTTGTKRSG